MTRPTKLDDVRPYPLMWPEERKRTAPANRDARKRWTGSFTTAIADLQNELTLARIHDWILSSNLRPHSNAANTVEDPGAALWFMQTVRGQWALSVLAADTYSLLWLNVKAIAMTLNRLRLIDDYGVYTVDQAIQGAAYLALPPPGDPPARPWRDVLAIDGEPPTSNVELVFHYRFLARKYAGDEAKLKELNVARDAARKELGVPTE